MEEVVVKPSLLKRLAIWAVAKLENSFFKMFRHFFFLLPPAILSYAATDKGVYEELSSWLPRLAPFIQSSAILTLSLCYLYVVFVKWLYKALVDYANSIDEIGKEQLLSILIVLDEVVSDKAKRMADYVKLCEGKPAICPANAFQTITQPIAQIAILAKAIRTVFEGIDKSGAFFKVGIMYVKDGKVHDWAAWQPHSDPPDTSLDDLSDPTSTISRAIETGSIVVVEDIQKELKKPSTKRRYVQGNTQPGEAGGQLCYPITHPVSRQVEYVITIAGNRRACFQESFTDIYTWILRHFATRISLEHSLHMIKERANERAEKGAA